MSATAMNFEIAFGGIKREKIWKILKARGINKKIKCSLSRRKNNKVFKQPEELDRMDFFIIVMDETSSKQVNEKKRKEPIWDTERLSQCFSVYK